jgi:2'-5' RNA ligase
LSARHTPQTLVDLVAELHRRLESCGFTPERRPFHAHLTLARKFAGPAPADLPGEPLCWHVDQMVLVESINEKDGVHYQVLRRWPVSEDKG